MLAEQAFAGGGLERGGGNLLWQFATATSLPRLPLPHKSKIAAYNDMEKVIEGFKTRLAKDLYRIKTGFIGTSLMPPTLMDADMVNDAYRILFNEAFPGWLYAVNLGTTTMWERLNSLLPDGRVNGTGMNSLNYYSVGSVCKAIYSRIAGLRRAGLGKSTHCAATALPLKRISLEFDSPSGTYKTA